eukprot:CAMPEP_0181176670 /NCGR_PEP_ID=MMETSP1096-20121128/4754_1 /TAXON_ID=156174 ORGANISM="Chrysochromulina ericina, Strain CCMP281" /NCGR_SAMPLE_ID=MMETSP1096 /ASSEMBLY_ACC=CAM_ASM_000453 /LENGTH=52 /DNA_ID=CAMNT_0023264775 /DNA_START=27 /DNA_END=185 /DNA_ORIENTATION=-
MTIKTLAAAVALTMLPALAFAAGCNYGKSAAMSCAEGTIYDADAGKCVSATT